MKFVAVTVAALAGVVLAAPTNPAHDLQPGLRPDPEFNDPQFDPQSNVPAPACSPHGTTCAPKDFTSWGTCDGKGGFLFVQKCPDGYVCLKTGDGSPTCVHTYFKIP